MTTTVIPSTSAPDAGERTRRPRWAAFGLAAGVSGIVAISASMATGAVYEEEIAGDAVAITDRLSELVPQILLFHTATMLSTLLLVVFAAGLHRQLNQRLGPDSLLPTVASFGLLLVAVAGLLGSGLTTEFVFGVADPDLLVPESAVFFGHWIGTIPWLWSGAGLTALVVAIAGLRHGVYSRWLSWTSAVMGGLITLFAVSPLQYMAGMVAPVWLTVTAATLLMSGRESA